MSVDAGSGAEPRLPDAAYFSLLGSLESGKGGTTSVLLARHRLLEPLLRERGEHLSILTFAARPCAEHWDRLVSEGQLLPGSRVRNLYRDLAGRSRLGRQTGVLRARAPLDAVRRGPSFPLDDGMTRSSWTAADGTRGVDVLRCDGSLMVRTVQSADGEDVTLWSPEGRRLGAWHGRDAFIRWWTARQLPSGRTSVIVSDGHVVGSAIAELGRRRDVVVVQQLHNPHRGTAYRRLREAAASFDRLVVLTARQRDDLVAMDGRCARNTVVVANPLAPSEPIPDHPPRRRHRIVVLARVHRQKGLDRAVRAFRILADQHGARLPGLCLDVYGKVEDPGLLAALREQAGGDDRIRFHGYRRDARSQLASAQVMWLTSRFEGYPLALLEAFEAGALVAANDCEYGPAELVEDGHTGFLVRITDDDVSELVDATLRAFALPPARVEAMRSAARRAAASGHHDPETYRRAWVDLIDRAAADHRRARPAARATVRDLLGRIRRTRHRT
ncbi:MAG: glycosyltransferase [Microbacterium sp.]|nr:MAG: glycosyltransferase [Microbacterium sp.]